MSKQRPILFSAPMVRAILWGSKTQTRRICTVPWHKGTRAQPYEPYYWVDGGKLWFDDNPEREVLCPYGQPGDRLWVRETWAALDREFEDPEVVYRADYRPGTGIYASPCNCGWCDDGENHAKWRPSIHMPRWASRITLEITGVRVERLQDINCGDCYAEGAPFPSIAETVGGVNKVARVSQVCDWYKDLWDSINGKREGAAWSSNPWVWVVEFKRAQP